MTDKTELPRRVKSESVVSSGLQEEEDSPAIVLLDK